LRAILYADYGPFCSFHVRFVLTVSVFVGQVRRDRTGVEPEWLMGRIGSREGLFPETFVQPASDSETVPPPSLYANAPVRFV